MADDIRASRRHARELAKALKELSFSVTVALNALALEMKKPSTPERGKIIAVICNQLDFANDSVRYFNLGVNWRTDKKGVSK